MQPATGGGGFACSPADIVRFFIIGSLSLTVLILSAIGLARDPASITPQLLYIPILYAAYYYPRQGVAVAGACAVAYEIIGSFYAFPDPARAIFVILQGVLFVAIAAVVAHLSEAVKSGTSECRALEARIEQDTVRRRGVISTVAHELRTPLQPLMGYLNLLLSYKESFGIGADTEKMLNRCLASVEREREIINQMLEFSVLEAGKLRLDYSVFSVKDVIDSVISSGRYSAQADIFVNIPEDLTFEADAGRFRTVVDSMLANAVAYSRNPRRIRIAYVSARTDPCHQLAISDNGIGIAPEQVGAIFEPFQLADSDMLSRKYERIGLSLSIAMRYMRMHGGTITVESIVNEGTTFTIHIPKNRGKDKERK